MNENLTEFLYLVTIVTFILALRFLSSPKRARQGNLLGAAGMALAIVVTLAQDGLENYGWMAVAMAIGTVIGVVGAILVAGRPDSDALTQVLGFFAVVLGTANAVGGFVVTDRMLEMFKKKPSQRDSERDSEQEPSERKPD